MADNAQTMKHQDLIATIKGKKDKVPLLKVTTNTKDKTLTIKGTAEETVLFFFKTFGTLDNDCADLLINQISNAHPSINENNTAHIINQTTPLLQAIAPQDELEGMLAVQMVGIHNLTMEMMQRASAPNQTVEGVNYNINRITKLSRTFTAQLEVLNKHRGKGQQKMTVEHVHINEGGQAVIGNVDKGEGKN